LRARRAGKPPFDEKVLTGVTPAFTAAQVQELLREHWGLAARSVSPLDSERDQNFKVDGDAGRYVLKIANSAEAPALTNLQTRAIRHVAATDAEVPVQRIVPTRTGSDSAFADGSTIRLLTWLNGIPLHLTPGGSAQRQSVAAGHARLVRALREFTSDSPPPVLQWDVKHAAKLRDGLDAVPQDLRESVEAALERFVRHAAPKLAGMPHQYVHNDMQPHNVVVDAQNTDRLSGILDFGDMVCTPVACDLGVACAYHVLPGSHPLQTVADYVAAFDAVRPLSDVELETLPALIMARQITTIVITSRRALTHPENAPYILRNRPIIKSGLEQLLPMSQDQAVEYLRSICR